MSARFAVGIGCRAEASAEAICAAVGVALERVGPGSASLHTTDRRAGSAALREAARRLSLPLAFHDATALARVAGAVVSHSPRVEAAFGVGSVAEAAALAGAGEGGRLVLAKLSAGGVSCAAAEAAAC